MKKVYFAFLLSVLALSCREIDSIEPNRAPIAQAGEDLSVPSGQSVSLDGSASSDPDGDSLSYTWTFLVKPAGSTAQINNFDSVKASFIPDRTGLYKLKLLVSDNVSSATDTLNVNSLVGNGSPVINAGNNAQVDLGTQYALNGTATDPDGDALTVSWSLQSKPIGSTATISNASSLNALVVIDKHGTYTARLQVSDGVFTVTDDVIITTRAVTISSINPTSGRYGITVKINGTNFSSTPGENTVTFNGTAAVVSAATYTSIDAVVPKGAGTGTVNVQVNGITATGPTFTYVLTPTVSTATQFASPFGLAADGGGNIYISDYNSHVIRRLTPAGVLTTLAGNGQAGYSDGKLLDAQFNRPAGIAVSGNNIFVVDNGNHCVRVISLTTGTVSTYAGFPQAGYADGSGAQAQFNSPIGLAADATGNLYVGDTGNGRVRKITTAQVVSTVAPNSAAFNGIAGVALDGNNNIYVAETLSHRIQKITPLEAVSVLAGTTTSGFVNATGTAARFNLPYDVACDAAGNVFVADFNNHSIRRITPQGVVTTVAGTGAAGFVEGVNAQFNQPTGVTVLANGDIYVADFTNQRIRKITFE